MSYYDIVYLGWILNIVGLLSFTVFVTIKTVAGNNDISFIFTNTKATNRKRYLFFIMIIIPFVIFFRTLYNLYILLSNKTIEEKMKMLRLEYK